MAFIIAYTVWALHQMKILEELHGRR